MRNNDDASHSLFRYEDKDDQDTLFEMLKKKKEEEGEADIVEYDENGYPLVRKGEKESLDIMIPFLDHSKITYLEINKDFYEEHEDIAAMAQPVRLGRTTYINV